ncbi:MAG: hypothetical protein J3K34DRAFT_455529 [Monoraphidium minutum]|nr:MAG: hypothetical protein J3K34DRAFT_455529 [Monoraphidium minutum]
MYRAVSLPRARAGFSRPRFYPRLAAAPEGKQATSKPVVDSSASTDDAQRISEFSREFLPKLLDEQEGAAQSGNELNKIVQWAGELGNKAQQALADLQKSVSFLGGDAAKSADGASAATIQETLDKLDGVSAAIADSNARFEAEFPAAAAAAAASTDGAEQVKSRAAYLNELADSLEVAEARVTEEAAAAASAAAGAAAEAAAATAAAAAEAAAATEAAAASAAAAAASEVEALAGAAAAAARAVKVEIAVRRETLPGQDVWVVGSAPALGGWDLGSALALEWTEGHVWRATIEVDPSEVPSIEYKAVLKCADGPTIWEGGDNKTADLVAGGAEVALLHEFAA